MPHPFEQYFLGIGKRIRQIREARGMHQTIAHEIRSKYGVKLDPSYLSRMERGETQIPLRTLLALSDYFDVNPGLLIDPTSVGNAVGVDFVFTDPELVKDLIRLKHTLGEARARYHLKLFVKQILILLESMQQKESHVHATRPTTEEQE